jgi:hypothetical protein
MAVSVAESTTSTQGQACKIASLSQILGVLVVFDKPIYILNAISSSLKAGWG